MFTKKDLCDKEHFSKFFTETCNS